MWTGNQIAGREQSQKMKKETQSAVVVPGGSWKLLGIFSRSCEVSVKVAFESGEVVAYPALPDGSYHDVDAVTAEVGLDAIPYASLEC